jgi:ABC-type branched-subunit amino acid transport system substrate-binding protein
MATRTRHALAALALALSVALAACGDGSVEDEARDGPLTIYVSAPLHGHSAEPGRAIANGARLALAGARGRAGDHDVEAVYLDDVPDGSDRWSPVRAAENARRAAQDTAAIAYIGELESGATRFSLPITNLARLLHVSAGSTAVDLTRGSQGDEPPERLQASGQRNFGRVVPSDDALDGSPPFKDPSTLPPAGRRFATDYEKRFSSPPDPAAAYGYEAMAVVLDSIRRAGEEGDNRRKVIEAFLETRDRKSVLGTYSIDSFGDTTLR